MILNEFWLNLSVNPFYTLLFAGLAVLLGIVPAGIVAVTFSTKTTDGTSTFTRAGKLFVMITVPLVGLPFFWALLSSHGNLQDVFIVDGDNGVRLAAFYQRTGRGTTCTLRIVDVKTGRLVGRHKRSSRCRLPSKHTARHLWYTYFSMGSGTQIESLDLYTGQVVVSANDVAKEHAQANPGVGEYKLSAPNSRGVVKIEFQDASTRWLLADGTLSESKPSQTQPSQLHTVKLEPRKLKRDGLKRAHLLDMKCGCEGLSKKQCGDFIVHSSTAFGDGVTQLGLFHDSDAVWGVSMPELGFAPASEAFGMHERNGQCMLIVSGRQEWVPKSVSRFLAPSNSGVVIFDRATGKVLSLSSL